MASILQLIEIYSSGLYADTNRTIYIDIAQGLVSAAFYGTNYNLAVCLMACHKWALNNRAGGNIGISGNVNNLREGDLSVGYSMGTEKSGYDDLSQTSYGLQLKSLTKSTMPGISVTGSSIAELQG